MTEASQWVSGAAAAACRDQQQQKRARRTSFWPGTPLGWAPLSRSFFTCVRVGWEFVAGACSWHVALPPGGISVTIREGRRRRLVTAGHIVASSARHFQPRIAMEEARGEQRRRDALEVLRK